MKLKVKDTISFVHWDGNNEAEIEAFMNDMGFDCETRKSRCGSISIDYKRCGKIVWDYNFYICIKKGQYLAENIYAEAEAEDFSDEIILVKHGFTRSIFEVVNDSPI